VTFFENTPYYQTDSPNQPTVLQPHNFIFPEETSQEQVEEDHTHASSAIPSGGDGEESQEEAQEEIAPDTNEGAIHEKPVLRRSVRQTRQPIRLRDYVSHQVMYPIQDYISYKNVSPTYRAYLGNIAHQTEPITWEDANQHLVWQKAMNEELQVLEKNHTWDIVYLPKGKKHVGCKWVYKIKYNSNGTIKIYKARLVAKGFTQTYGVDYQETFAPVAKMSTVRILLSVATNLGWNLFQMNVNNAFLQGVLDEEVYMTLPPGYNTTLDSSQVCKLKKSIYGLKQSPRVWYAKLSSSLLKNNFVKSIADSSMFIKHKHDCTTIILVYVDDIIITGNNNEEINLVK
jgi:Reverse transcriptase (RNA-dependent DNA polymerase)